MTKHQELTRAYEKTNDYKQEVMNVTIRLNAIKRELDLYLLAELQYVENINILKRNKIIALALEYKKAKDQLNYVRRQIDFSSRELAKLGRALKINEKLLAEAELNYDIVVKRYENNVVLGRFGKKDGQG